MLVIVLQPTDDNSSLGLGEELGVVWEVLNDPVGKEPSHDGGETFQDKDPRPTRFPANAVHIRDAGLLKTKSVEIRRKLRISHTASRPPNAPDTDAAEKKTAERMPNSERLYQLKEG